ncbi:MAG: protein restricted to Verrucomicrobia-Planctomycetes group [Verrucomicrobiaceae bacterium]|nr:protein restricted to Verrucomicrobia-Planctomycetes group [Verrucomicrobiaceae bacterium]MDB6118080.1 protein restricted to Verrucomicrobia-Planctomycetes group [Verrucomicrobiaceae bacterium]
MSDILFEEAVQLSIDRDPRYTQEAYEFVREALHVSVKKFCNGDDGQHVAGQQLLEGAREHALKEYGPMAAFILRQWGVTQGIDIGHIVYNLINAKYFGRSQGDSLDDFAGGPDFEESLSKPFLPQKVKSSS